MNRGISAFVEISRTSEISKTSAASFGLRSGNRAALARMQFAAGEIDQLNIVRFGNARQIVGSHADQWRQELIRALRIFAQPLIANLDTLHNIAASNPLIGGKTRAEGDSMLTDSIIDEVRANRAALAARYQNDLTQFVAVESSDA